MYNDKIMERFRAAKNAGSLSGANGKGEVGNVACGDILKLYITVDADDVIREAKFKTFGCVAAIVSTDIACDLIRGKKIATALKISKKDIISQMGGEIPPQKIHCSVLATEAIAAAVADFRKKHRPVEEKSKAKTAKKK